MNTKTPELLPCPFCGSRLAELTGAFRHHYRVCCVSCGADGPNGAAIDGSIEAWNTRYFGGVEKLSSDDSECKTPPPPT